MGEKTWGPEIWNRKAQLHTDNAVIMGVGASNKRISKNTQRTLEILNKIFLPLIPKGGTLLDVGVGPLARLALPISGFGYKVTGLDGSAIALERAKLAIDKSGLDRINLVQADLISFTTAESFDGLYCIETFFHVPAHLSLITFSNFNRALKPKGKLCVQFSVLDEMTPKFLFINLIYMTIYKILAPIWRRMGWGAFLVTVARHTTQEIEDIAARSGFKVVERFEDYFVFEKNL